MTHPNNRAKPKPRLFNDLGLYKTEFEIKEDNIVKTIEELKIAARKTLQDFFKPAEECKTLTEAEIKDGAVRKLYESQNRLKEMVEEERLYQEQIAREAINMLNEKFDYKMKEEDSFDWYSDDDLIHVKWSPSTIAVANEYFTLAEKTFDNMIEKYQLNQDPKYAPFISFAKKGLTLTRSGRINEKAVRDLKNMKDVDVKSMPEWLIFTGYLNVAIEDHAKKMSLSIAARQSPKHEMKKVFF